MYTFTSIRHLRNINQLTRLFISTGETILKTATSFGCFCDFTGVAEPEWNLVFKFISCCSNFVKSAIILLHDPFMVLDVHPCWYCEACAHDQQQQEVNKWAVHVSGRYIQYVENVLLPRLSLEWSMQSLFRLLYIFQPLI